MPIYEYICDKCNEKFSILQSINKNEKDTECPKCTSRKVNKIMSSFCCSAGSGAGFGSPMPSSGLGGGG